METGVALFALAFGAGVVHGFGADHALAMAIAMPARPTWRAALAVGLKFGIGHFVALIGFGVLPFAAGLAIPVDVWSGIERGLGVVLALIGVVLLLRLLGALPAIHSHGHSHGEGGDTREPQHDDKSTARRAEHRHLHFHFASNAEEHGRTAHPHPHGVWALGLLFGLGGAGAIVPRLAAIGTGDAILIGVAVALVFGAGVTATMVTVALVIRGAEGAISRRPRIRKGMYATVALASVAVGLSMAAF